MTVNPKEHLDNFLKAVMVKEALVKDVMKYLTKTQQHDSKYIGKITPIANINGLYSVLKQATSFTTKEKINTNPLVSDFIIKLQGTGGFTKLECRLVKESAPRKADKDGIWGVNASSFKYVD